MMHYTCGLILLGACGLLLQFGCAGSRSVDEPAFSAGELPVSAGGRPAVFLRHARSADKTQPQILEAQILPGRGMNTYQLRAYLPGKGDIDVLVSPPIEQGVAALTDANASFKLGGAILVPFANRIRGKLSPDGQTIETTIAGQTVHIPANWQGKNAGAEKHAIHGLILARQMDDVKTAADAQQASVTGTLHAGDFDGHWLSKTDLTIAASLTKSAFGFTVDAKNVGDSPMPIGIGWHPYFTLPSGNRQQVRLHIPAKMRALANNYDDVFPTGDLTPVEGSAYDFAGASGAPLNQLFLDDCFTALERDAAGHAATTIVDPAAKYGVRITALAPQIKAFQAYAPLDKTFVAIEPQFNLGDPFSPFWQKSHTDSGMVVLNPGESVQYAVQVELFVP
jgi:aldose 1-epimerase